ncbi:protein involved in cell division [Sphaerochaeta pleomorpha str. Grapes]|uniref:protein adenylyltransferase n=2 Tax=Sphaerochaeta TaxID=399320 RepID=G8QT65_SPHPG|nr:protein involved in cell division [Sphaerochaeta pleomorpha str. Grapes]
MVSFFMKSGRMQACIDYIRFNHEAEGFVFSDIDESAITRILEGDLTPDEYIQELIDSNGLNTNYIPPANEGGFYPHTSCLVNFFSIKERTKLRKIEALFANVRSAEILTEDPKNTFDFEYLKSIHARLFGDLYPSSGQIRTMTAAKRTVFSNPEFIESASEDIFSRLRKDRYLKDLEREDFINDLAFYMGEVEALHPFRDGNGRAARLFFYQLVLNAGYDLDWSMVDPDRLLEADIAAIDGDYQLLIDVLEEVIR